MTQGTIDSANAIAVDVYDSDMWADAVKIREINYPLWQDRLLYFIIICMSGINYYNPDSYN